ncbi:MAG: sigma-70 family RNA polymerase sigma factor [Chloroflexi bacterium]|uniref:Sigma-70 family RNA polymerase sigma factor n=1 Tax=Candidatus Chlorohelix allophototropha TaxID=3003348 RepID=A0A8T7MAW9_9CHLR|nr:sigma-70 family RNA polymerase sigma factor [Chloroflexota bacterium]
MLGKLESTECLETTLVSDLPLGTIILRCREQTARYLRRESYDSSACFELWRRAIVLKDEGAWEAIYNNYRPFVRNWLQRSTGKYPMVNLEEDVLINGVFFRIMRYLTPDKFSKFPSLASILQYLRMCCQTEVMDLMRDLQGRNQDVPIDGFNDDDSSDDHGLKHLDRIGSLVDVEKEAIDTADRNPFWSLVAVRLPDKVDQLVVHARFVLEMPPRDIAQSFPQYLPDVNEVYRRIKNAIWRLKNDPELRDWLENR